MTFPSVIGYHPEQHRLVAGRAALDLQTGAPGSCPHSHTLPLASVRRFTGLIRDARRLATEVDKIEEQLQGAGGRRRAA